MKLSDYITVINGKNQKKVESLDGEYPIYGSGGQMGRATDFICSKNTVIIGRKGTINTPIFVDEPFWNVDTAFGLSPKHNLDAKYLYWFCKHFNFMTISTSTTIPSLTKTSIENIDVRFPSKERQVTISKELDNLQKGLNALKTRDLTLSELVKSRFIEMFGDPMDEKKWNSKFTEVVIFNPKKSEVKKDMEIEASFVPMEAIGTDGSFSIKKSGKIKDFYKRYTYFKDGDVIFAKITPCFENGKIAIANHCTNKIGFGTTEFHVARPISGKANAEWVMNLLRNDSLHTYASSKMTGSAGQKRIQTPFFEKLGVYLPPLELQNRFADFVHLIDKSRFVCHSRNFL